MGRKNVFEAALDAAAPPISTVALRRQGAPSMATLGSTLRDMSASGIQELDPWVIDESGIQDRIALEAADIARLAESIRTHGQQVPILVRPHPDSMNRFIIVYGRRRLAAVRSLGNGMRVKAIVRHLAEDAAIIAQGQENNLRVDPSYIEKALFVRELREAGYQNQVIQDALGLDRTAISKMNTVVDNVPVEVILFIGAAPEIGRRQWTELAFLAREHGIDLLSLVPEKSATPSTGSERFENILSQTQRLAGLADAPVAPVPERKAAVPAVTAMKDRALSSDIRRFDLGGRHLGTMKKTGRSLSLSVSLRHQPQFGQWFEENADEIVQMIHDHWSKSRGEG
ncbi:MAG: plasmid partitioning protein RepB [Alphaproteobacteria bacterium]|nr:plasmid partitioning protein RepB [Alphaproteobacteria bacterium]